MKLLRWVWNWSPVAVLMANGLLGAILWTEFLTDYEWSHLGLTAAFPLVVGGCAAVSMRWLRSRKPEGSRLRWRDRAICVPGLVGGAAYLLAVILFAGPMLPAWFWLDEQSKAVVIQQEASPSGGKMAEVVFYPVGAYQGGNGRIVVFVSRLGLPLVRRRVYSLGRSFAEGTPADYLAWQDEETIVTEEELEPISIGKVRWEVPFFVQVPLGYARTFGLFDRGEVPLLDPEEE